MELRRRFVFHGNVSAYGGWIYSPKQVVIATGAASSLGPSGGLSIARAKRAEFLDGYVRFGTAETEARGNFDGLKRAVALTNRRVEEETLSTTTRVRTWVENIQIGKKPRLRIGWTGGSTISRSAPPGEEPSFRLVGRETGIEEVVIDDVKVKITLNTSLLDKLDTMSKVRAAIVDPAFNQESNDCFFRQGIDRSRTSMAGTSQTTSEQEVLFGTLVRKLEWGTKAGHPRAQIERHSIVIPDLGTVFFGELLVRSYSRRFTTCRIELGSPVKGRLDVASYDGNGSWIPP